MRPKPTIVASAFIKKDNKYLITYDPKFRFWRVPGGRPEYGEKVEDALQREILEELDIKIAIEKFLGFGEDVVKVYGVPGKEESSRLILYFECEILSGTINVKEKKEISDFKWLTMEEIMKIEDLEPAMKDFFERFNILKK